MYPGALKVILNIFPGDFSYHKNGKMTHCHMAYWYLFPMIDHFRPYAHGGDNIEDNLVIASMMNNDMRSGYDLECLGR